MKSYIIKSVCLLFALIFICFSAGCAEKEQFTLVDNAVLGETRYRLGDTMGDYTLTDVNGVTYTFSDILREKKAIVLNFWFINCTPCCIEFPYLDEAYNEYKDDIEVLAINCVDEKESDVSAFKAENNLSFPVIAGDRAWSESINIQGYPTTVVIDRYGTVSMIHTGYIDSAEPFRKVFEFFTHEEYVPSLVENIEDIM